jgi:hypothetical protein
VAHATAIGWRTTTTNRASGKSAWRNLVRRMFGGDFSTTVIAFGDQYGCQSASRRSRLSRVASGEASVRCADAE